MRSPVCYTASEKLHCLMFQETKKASSASSAGSGDRRLQNPSTVSFTSFPPAIAPAAAVPNPSTGAQNNANPRNISIPGKRQATFIDIKLKPQNQNSKLDAKDDDSDVFSMKLQNHRQQPKYSSATSWKHASDREKTHGIQPLGQQQQNKMADNKMAAHRKLSLAIGRLDSDFHSNSSNVAENRTHRAGMSGVSNGKLARSSSLTGSGVDSVLGTLRTYSTIATEGELSTGRSTIGD